MKEGDFIQKYKDISEVYNIYKIDDSSILLKDKEKIIKEVIYEVLPISMLNYSDEEITKVLEIYIEFLKSVNVKFKILIKNVKFDKNDYLDRHFNNLIASKEIYRNYINSIKEKIKKEDIYTSKIYICFICNENEEKEIDDSLRRLNTARIVIKKLTNKEIIKLLYSTINKV